MPPIVNLGILAHVDAGKTSLTERLLHLAGVVDQPGRVDDGNTRTDSLALERRRGITIKSAVVSFALAGVTVNLIDTPGHPDFIAEVERVLGVLDGAVLVVSAVEGVQAQTRILHRTLARLRIPTLIMVNKVDRRGARPAAVLAEIAEKLTPAVVAGSRRSTARAPARPPSTPQEPPTTSRVLAEHDDALLAAYVEGRPVPSARAAGSAAATRPAARSSTPSSSARRSPARASSTWPPASPSSCPPRRRAARRRARCSRSSAAPAGERVAYVRMLAGAVHLRDRVLGDVVTGLDVFADGALVRRPVVRAGEIAQLRGLTRVRIGDAIGRRRPPGAALRAAEPGVGRDAMPAPGTAPPSSPRSPSWPSRTR